MGKLRLYLAELRAPFFTASLVPIGLGTAIAWARAGEFHPIYFLLALIGGVALHAGTNVANDYFDHLSGNDLINREFVSPFSGGSRLIQRGLLAPDEVLRESLVLFTLGILIGLYLAWTRGPLILLLGVVGVFSGYFYTAPPLRLANLGVGEVLVGVNFGILMTLGAYYVQTRSLAWEPVVAAVPLAFLITAVLYINEFPDYEADRAVGKTHLVVRLGRRKAVTGYMALIIAAYLSIVVGVIGGGIPSWSLLALFPFPHSLKAVRITRLYYDHPPTMAPANKATIVIHLGVGSLLCLGYILERTL